MLLKEFDGRTTAFSLNGDRKEVSYLTRVDPLSGGVARISEERARRGFGIVANLDIQPVEGCQFCSYLDNTPGERIPHQGGAVSVPNKFPWEKHDWITIYPPFGGHKLFLSDLYFDDMEMMVESSYDLALLCSRDPDVISFMDFTNWGTFAGASQQHPHSQRRSITFVPDPKQDAELHRCRQLAERYGRNPFC
jgi:galactose-1-phosphate uridylyltransferase